MVADGPTRGVGRRRSRRARRPGGRRPPAGRCPRAAPGPPPPLPGQPDGYTPFVGPICSQDGKAAIVTAYLKGDGESDTILDPLQDWRDSVSDPGGGLEVKITGGAGYAADAIEVFESINGTLLLAAVSLVIFLLIAIYRSPIFLFIPLTAVIFAEMLARSVGYGLSELGVTINGQSSSIMSVLVLGAGTDYALLIVARYREELHRTEDRHEAMRAAMTLRGPGGVRLGRHRDRGAAVPDHREGERHLGPRARSRAMGVACAALSMLTLLPALLTIFGRRAFWPFVPAHARVERRPHAADAAASGARIVEGSKPAALLPVIGACLLVFRAAAARHPQRRCCGAVDGGKRIPSLIVGPLDRAVFTPYELRRFKHEHLADATHGFWKRVGDWVAPHTSARAGGLDRGAAA